MSVTQQQAISLLENVLFESATQAAANAASWLANSAAGSISTLATAMAASPEEGIAAHIVGYYLTALGRAPTATEIRFYVSYAEQGLTSAQIAAGQVPASTWSSVASFFTNSPEFANRSQLDYSLGATGALLEAVPWLYQSVLGRAPTTGEISFYDSLVASGTSLTSLFGYFTGSQEFHTDTASQIAAALASNGTAVASGQPVPATIGATVTLGPPPPLPPPPSPPAATSISLTTGTDNLTATSASLSFIGTLGGGSPTLTANDALHGAGNGLKITDTSGATSQDLVPSGVTLTNIVSVSLTTSGNAGTDAAHFFDLSGVTGLTSVTLESSGTQGDFLNAGTASSISVTTHGGGDMVAIASSAASLTVDGAGTGISVSSIIDAGLTSLTLTGDVALASSGTPQVLGVTSFTVSGASDAGAVSLSFVLTGTAGGNGGNFNAGGGGAGGDGGPGGTAGGGTITLGGGADNFTDHGVGGAGGNGGSMTTGGGAGGVGGNGGAGGAAGHETISLGNGADTIIIDSTGGSGGSGGAAIVTGGGGGCDGGNGGSGGDAGHDAITLGNGSNIVTDNSVGGAGGAGGAASATGGGGAIGGNGGSGGSAGHNTITVGNGDNTITDNSTGGSGGAAGAAAFNGTAGSGGTSGNDVITVGTGQNTIDLRNHADDTVILGTNAGYNTSLQFANQLIENAGAGTLIGFANLTSGSPTLFHDATVLSDPNAFIALLVADVTGHPHMAAYGTEGGNTFLVESATGTPGSTDTVMLVVLGTHSFSISGSDLVLG